MNKFYITTTLPYVNAEPHIGFALEIVQADAIARLHKLLGDEVVFNFGTDEHGKKIYQKALEAGKDPQEYCDFYALKFKTLQEVLNLSCTNFIRTTDQHHIEAAQEFWIRCEQNGFIEKKNYQSKYCVGCELEKTDSELVDGKCPFHPTREIEILDEENYFFKFSLFSKPLLEFYEKNPNFVVPEKKGREIKSFVEQGLQDFSISRLKKKLPWGIPVPNDPDHVMYVWFDALVNYISTLGWPKNEEQFNDFWPGIQVAGKDNLRQQTAIWQAMLMAAGLPNSKQVFIHGFFIDPNGQKVSKSIGNVGIGPVEISEKYGIDALRYFLLAKTHPYEDSVFTIERFEEVFNSDLANGLGNLVARIAKLAEKTGKKFKIAEWSYKSSEIEPIRMLLDEFNFNEAVGIVWKWVGELNQKIDEGKPWTLTDSELFDFFEKEKIVDGVVKIATALQPFIPETANKIIEAFKSGEIKTISPLFPRIK